MLEFSRPGIRPPYLCKQTAKTNIQRIKPKTVPERSRDVSSSSGRAMCLMVSFRPGTTTSGKQALPQSVNRGDRFGLEIEIKWTAGGLDAQDRLADRQPANRILACQRDLRVLATRRVNNQHSLGPVDCRPDFDRAYRGSDMKGQVDLLAAQYAQISSKQGYKRHGNF